MKRAWHEWIVSGSVSENLAKQNGYIELIRCKDCKYAAKDMACTHKHEWGNEVSRNHDDPNWFCADGERKE